MTGNVTLPILAGDNKKIFRIGTVLSILGIIGLILTVNFLEPSSTERGIGVGVSVLLGTARFTMGFFIEEYKTVGVIRISDKGITVRKKGEEKVVYAPKDFQDLSYTFEDYQGQAKIGDMMKGNSLNVSEGTENKIWWTTKDGRSEEIQFKLRNRSEYMRLTKVFNEWEF